MESTAEQSLSPKKKPSQTLENGNKLKRKSENDNDLQNVIAKSPKKAVVAATRTSRRIKDLELVDEVVLVELPKMKRGSKKDASIEVELVDEVVPVVAPKGKRVSKKLAPIEGNASVKVSKIETVQVITSLVKSPVAPRLNSPLVNDNNSQDERKYFLAPTKSTDNEIVGLYQQYWSSLDLCMSTMTPLFITLILMSYVISALTNSQEIASIGLVYTFVFLGIMGTYVFTIIPFVLISNAISSLIAPNGLSAQRDFSRVAMLSIAIGLVVAYFKYGAKM